MPTPLTSLNPRASEYQAPSNFQTPKKFQPSACAYESSDNNILRSIVFCITKNGAMQRSEAIVVRSI